MSISFLVMISYYGTWDIPIRGMAEGTWDLYAFSLTSAFEAEIISKFKNVI